MSNEIKTIAQMLSNVENNLQIKEYFTYIIIILSNLLLELKSNIITIEYEKKIL